MFEELKPCPFCGEKAIFYETSTKKDDDDIGFEFTIRCGNCGVKLPNYYTVNFYLDTDGKIKTLTDGREKAIKAWNRRAAVNER